MPHLFKLSLLAAVTMSTSVQAEDTFRQHDAHVHGHVEFNIAQDNNELLIEITAPGSDVVGFEHAPKNEQQHDVIEKAEQTLKQADKLMLLSSAAKCKIEHISVSNTLENETQHDSHEGHDHEKEPHGDEHEGHEHEDHEKHESHESHESHEHEEHEENGKHGQFTIEYHFDCGDISALQQIETTWFTHFPNTDEISVNVLTDKAQTAQS